MLKRMMNVCSLIVFASVSSSLLAVDYFVASNGNDANPGSLNSPFKTIAKAAEVAVAGDVVNIREGTYAEILRPANSGSVDSPITFQAYQSEKVVISAMQALDNWVQDSANVYRTQVTWDLDQENFVMHESTALDLARWPNNSDGDPFTQNTLRNSGGSGPNVIIDAALDYSAGIPNHDWSKGGSVYFYGDKPGSGWLAWKAKIKSSTTTQVKFDLDKNPTWIRTFHAPADKGEFFLEGIKEALDYQNEWYFDKDTQMLYVQLADGVAPQAGSVKMRRRILTVDLRNRNYIHLKNFAVFGGSINITGSASHNKLSNISSFYGNYTRGIMRGFASNSQSVHVQGSNNIIEHSEIAFGSATGVRDDGVATQILNSYIHDFNLIGSYDAALLARGGRDSIIRGNTISRAGRDAVQAINRNLVFSYNDVSYSNLIADDCALFYTLGGPLNMEIHHNWFHDAYSSGTKRKAAGIYLDNDARGIKVHHNVVWNTEWSSIQMNWDALNNDIFNNTFVNGSQTMGAWHKPGTMFENVRVWNNLSDQNQWEPQSDKRNNVSYTQDPFVNSAQGDFSLKANSQAVNQGIFINDITDDVTDGAPDVGAYEFGNTPWVAGVSWDKSKGAAQRCYALPGEVCVTSSEPEIVDTDGDGVNDDEDAFPLDASESVDTDGDGQGNNADVDDDGDGVNDSEDAFPLDASESVDTDGDGQGNNADVDDDGDGVSDSEDAFALDASESVDTDGDGVGDNSDNCVSIANTDQQDSNNDGVGDACESPATGTNPIEPVPEPEDNSGGGSMGLLLLLFLLMKYIRVSNKS